ncbi:MAG: IS200/IS605 family element transposase accessory protein TnpB [Lachnospiraceae bacterium]|nr:IS200/IS605 family element transposase accessory protein TnpB [Lachnospiraceae bacterium]
MIKTIKVKLCPNRKQETRMFQYAGASRFAYNWALAKEQENYKNGGKFISDADLRKEFTQRKKTEEYAWLNHVSNNVTKQAIKDACHAYKRFFKGLGKFPRFKSRKHSIPSFYQDNVKIKFTDTHVKVEGFTDSKKKNKQKLNLIKLAEHGRIPAENTKYTNPRIKYDGIDWWITVGIECEVSASAWNNHGVEIDLGIKDLAVCSDGKNYQNINKTQKVKKIEKKKRRLQRSISRKYEKNKKGECYCKTGGIRKSEKKLLKLNHRLTNIRQNYLHQTTSEIIKREPSFICMEDLNVSGMMKNRHLSKAVQQQCFGEFRRQIEYKAKWNHIPIMIADRFFPSSKLCSCCGNIKKDLKLSDRIYKCKCRNMIDRDYQAAFNLKRYGKMALESSVTVKS